MNFLTQLFLKKKRNELQDTLDRSQIIVDKINTNFDKLSKVYWYYYIESLRKKLDEISNIDMKARTTEIIDLLNEYKKVHKNIKKIYTENVKKYKKYIPKLTDVDSFYDNLEKRIRNLITEIYHIVDYKSFHDLEVLRNELKILLIKVLQIKKELLPIIEENKSNEKPHKI